MSTLLPHTPTVATTVVTKDVVIHQDEENTNPQILNDVPGSTIKGPTKRRSLAAGEARRDRFADHRRPGTGRVPIRREVLLPGRLQPKVGKKDLNGFDSLDSFFDADDQSKPSKPKDTKRDSGLDDSFNALPFDVKSAAPSPTRSEAPFDISYAVEYDDDGDEEDGVDMDAGMPEVDVEVPDQNDHESVAEFKAPEPRPSLSSAAAEAKQKDSQVVKNKAAKSRRRQTLKMIDAAQSAGALAAAPSNAGGVRRSSRARFRPLAYWRNQRMNFRRTDTGLGSLLPVLDEEKPIATPAKDDEQKPPKRKPKDLEDVKKKLDLKGESKADEKERAPVDPIAWVVDPVNGTKCRKAVAQSAMNLKMQPLPQQTEDDKPLPMDKVPRACKSFDESVWSTGMLQLPPGAQKSAEEAGVTEVFYVAACATNALRVTINETRYKFSKGDTFFVPTGNTYSMKNKSKDCDVKLVFTLIAGDSASPSSPDAALKRKRSGKVDKPSQAKDMANSKKRKQKV